MYRSEMPTTLRRTLLISFGLVMLILAGCRSDGGTEVAAASADATSDTADAPDDADDDHADEEHGDEDGHHDDHDDHDDEGSASGLGAHVHGEAELLVALFGGDVSVDLISPTENVFGFEYEPSTEEDKAVAEERSSALVGPQILVFNAEAECGPASEPATEVVYEGSHAEIIASWIFSCSNPDQITELDASSLFQEFPGFVDIDVQWASDTLQSAAELSASSPVLQFES